MLQILAGQAGMIDWNRVILLWGDERNVAPEHEESNFRMVKENLLDSISIPPENVLAIPSPGDDVFKSAKRYEAILRERIKAERDGQPLIDCVLLGMGDDVHTASLFPGTAALSESKKTFVGNEVPQLETFRMTLTAPAINAARNVAFLISGEKKQEALLKLWHAEASPALLPSQLIRPTAGQLYFLVDKAALGDTPLPQNSLMQMI
jgi:6-phosphogluconolactonase